MIENVDRRVLAGFRCVDAITGFSVQQPLSISPGNLVVRRTRSGIFAVIDAPGLRSATTQFVAPAPALWPAPSSFEITIQDPSFRYLSRRAQISVPQPLPAAVAPGSSPPAPTTTAMVTTTLAPGTTAAVTTTPAPTTTVAAGPVPIPPVTTPQDIVLYPTPAAPVGPNWAVARISVINNATPPAFLPWTVIQIFISGRAPVTGVTNQFGQALAAVPGLGLQLSSNSSGAVTETTTAAIVNAFFDPAVLAQPQDWIPNPDDILANLGSSRLKNVSTTVQLAPGQTVFVNLTIAM
jgi:hypothetical protein